MPPTTRLVVSDDLVLESRDETHVVVVNTESARRMKLSLAAYRFLRAFDRPCRLDQVVSSPVAAGLLPQLRMLIDKRMLVDADAPIAPEPTRLRTVAYKFCGAPAYAAPAHADFVIVGVPYDLAGDGDSRGAPALIRRKSLDYTYQLDFADGRPRGWFDVNRGAWMLRGATIADAGDVAIEYGEDRARFVEHVGKALARCCAGGSVPVILGGDRSVTRATLGGLLRAGKLTVVQLTADPEGAAAEGAGAQLSRLDAVERVIAICGEGASPEATVRAWGDALSIYLSIDLSIVTDAAGPPLHALKEWVAAVGKVHRIVAIDLVGLDLRSGSAGLTAISGCHLALAAMSAAYDRR